MRTEQLYYFLEAVRCGSFSKAAENLYIKQPSLREAINNLEKEVGAKLFFTTNKGVKLTNYGQQCLPTFTRIIQMYESIKLQNQPDPTKSLKIGIDLYVNHIRSKIFSMQDNLYDNLLLAQTLQYTIYQDPAALFAKLFAKEVDAICLLLPDTANDFSAALNAKIEHDTIQYTIFPIEIFAIISKNHPISGAKSISLPDLQPFLILTDDTLQYTLRQYIKQIGINLNLQTVNEKMQSNLLFFNNAICLTHNYYLEKDINFSNKPNIRKIPLNHIFHLKIVLYHLKSTEKNEQIRSYISIMQSLENYHNN